MQYRTKNTVFTQTHTTRICIHVSHEHNHGTILNRWRQDSQGVVTQSNCRVASMLCSSTHRFFDNQHQSWKLQHKLPTDSISLQNVDFVLMKCSRVHCANEYCFEDEVLNELTKLQSEGPDSQWLEAERWACILTSWFSWYVQLIGNWGFKFLLKFLISKLFKITKMGRWNTINMATCWRCNQNNSWSEYKIKVTQDKGKTKRNGGRGKPTQNRGN